MMTYLLAGSNLGPVDVTDPKSVIQMHQFNAVAKYDFSTNNSVLASNGYQG